MNSVLYSFQGSEGNDILTMPSFGLTTGTKSIYGLGGDDTITGGVYNDKLYGGSGDDHLFGQAGNDTLYGDDGADTLTVGDGIDTLYGGNNADIFVFASANTNSDTIGDFSLSQGDKIDLSDILQGYDPLTQAITDFVQITTSGANSLLKVDVDGGANSFVQIATITGVTGLTDEAALVTSGHLIVT
jgi:Ca2+-binding RTX toxin-like protein